MSKNKPRFLADVMLGRLARWLRALGYDTHYDSSLDDAALAELARRESRILLTRDVELTRRKNLKTLLIQDDKVMQQLRQVIHALGLDEDAAFTRCVECNAELIALEHAHAAALVPPYVMKTQTRFRRCPKCGKVYWRGTHWSHMQNAVRELRISDEE
jgi:uncharacterized protein with PIN domain